MKKILLCVAASALMVAAPRAADTWKGTLSDSMCGVKHAAEKQGQNAQKHRDCIEKCAKDGEQYVFVTGDKIYKIANQDLAALKVHAGREVNLTGEMKEDTITVSKVEMPKKEGAK
jgi:hypothetical protein